ncbi:hypothetical protein [Sphingomonas sp. Ant20]|uniref:hypothetical protein n=1 Tax=Sphingomonas sp. Ant20 TaxID=104605 RepID=UPI000FE14350|nr:hypothetical protein [Sphingomonas sp. Ant20]
MTNKTEQQVVAVAQQDREAAAAVIFKPEDGEARLAMLQGALDDHCFVQAFARHRPAAPPVRSYAEGVEDAANVAAKVAAKWEALAEHDPNRGDDQFWEAGKAAAEQVAAAIRLSLNLENARG